MNSECRRPVFLNCVTVNRSSDRRSSVRVGAARTAARQQLRDPASFLIFPPTYNIDISGQASILQAASWRSIFGLWLCARRRAPLSTAEQRSAHAVPILGAAQNLSAAVKRARPDTRAVSQPFRSTQGSKAAKHQGSKTPNKWPRNPPKKRRKPPRSPAAPWRPTATTRRRA